MPDGHPQAGSSAHRTTPALGQQSAKVNEAQESGVSAGSGDPISSGNHVHDRRLRRSLGLRVVPDEHVGAGHGDLLLVCAPQERGEERE